MPYINTPPGVCRASKIVTRCPSLAKSAAQVKPAGPEPTTATFYRWGVRLPGIPCRWPFPSRHRNARSGRWRRACFFAQGAVLLTLVFLGADPAANSGQGVFSLIFLAAPAKSPSAASLMKPEMSISTGQPCLQGIFLQCRHRLASSITAASL